MIQYNWNNEKNEILKDERGISFERIILHIKQGDLLDIVAHPNSEKYSHQKILIVLVNDYVYAVPFVEDGDIRFLKTIFASRKLTKKYLGEKNE